VRLSIEGRRAPLPQHRIEAIAACVAGALDREHLNIPAYAKPQYRWSESPYGPDHAFVLRVDGTMLVRTFWPEVKDVAPYVQALRAMGLDVAFEVLPITHAEWLARLHRPFWIDDEERPSGVTCLPGAWYDPDGGPDPDNVSTAARYPGSRLPDILAANYWRSFDEEPAPTDQCAMHADRGGVVQVRCSGACRVQHG
jgi:hypothetical protein